MSYMSIIGAAQAILLGTGLSLGGAIAGTAFATVGTQALLTASKKMAKKEQNCKSDTTQASWYKAAKWGLLVLSALTGTAGAAMAGLSVFSGMQIISLGSLTPISIAAGIVTTVALQIFVIHKISKQAHALCMD